MPEAVTVECGFCHKHFRCPPEVHVRNVRCPFCKTIVKVPASGDAGHEASEAISDKIATEKADRDRVPLSVRHRVAPPPRGVRSRAVVIVWLSLLGVGLITGGIGIYLLHGRGTPPDSTTPPASKAPAAASKVARESPTAGAPAPGTPPGEAAPGAKDVAPPAPVPDEAVTVKVERFLGGFKDATVTYVVGRVKNNTNAMIRVIKVKLTIADKEDKELGEATQTILNLPAGATAPLVAEWQHAEGVIGRKWLLSYQLNPMGVTQDLPPVVCEDAVAIRDPNNASTTGKIKVRVTNQGALALPQVQFYAIIISPEGKIAGVAKAAVDQQLPPKKAVDVTFPWVNCSAHLVQSVEVWAQAGL
jgi:hypothetical protein